MTDLCLDWTPLRGCWRPLCSRVALRPLGSDRTEGHHRVRAIEGREVRGAHVAASACSACSACSNASLASSILRSLCRSLRCLSFSTLALAEASAACAAACAELSAPSAPPLDSPAGDLEPDAPPSRDVLASPLDEAQPAPPPAAALLAFALPLFFCFPCHQSSPHPVSDVSVRCAGGGAGYPRCESMWRESAAPTRAPCPWPPPPPPPPRAPPPR